MAKDDFSVLAYYILKYLYACAKSGISPKRDTLMLKEYPLKVGDEFAEFVLITLFEEGFIKGLELMEVPVIGAGKMETIKEMENVKITMKGMQYLEDNSKTAKAYDLLKKFKESIPFI